MANVIALKNISKTYWLTSENKVIALQKTDLAITNGEFVSIMGPSGSGKSTLLNIIGLLDLPDDDKNSEIIINSQNILKLASGKLAALRRQTIGFVFQSFNLLPKLSAFNNVLLPMRYANVPRKIAKNKTIELLKLVNLSNRAHHKPSELSGGEKQRVAIARALANNPKIILADEPTGNLDSRAGQDIINILKKLNQEKGVTIAIVTHDQKIASETKRIIKLKDGVVC